MQTIWKYEVLPYDFTVPMPKLAQFLSVQIQFVTPKMWWLVDPNMELETRYFLTFPTGGMPFDATNLIFLGSFQINGGRLVFHLFENPH